MHKTWVVKTVTELHLAVSVSCFISRVPFDIEFYEIDTPLYYQNFLLRIPVKLMIFFYSKNDINSWKVVTLKWNFIEINSQRKFFDDSPVRKKRRKNKM